MDWTLKRVDVIENGRYRLDVIGSRRYREWMI